MLPLPMYLMCLEKEQWLSRQRPQLHSEGLPNSYSAGVSCKANEEFANTFTSSA